MTGLRQSLLEYHQRSKHRVNRYAPGPGGLDWANQPDPFREFRGALQIKLPLAAARTLLAALPDHLADMAAFSLATGLRRANVTGLQWTQVDLVRRLAWIHPDEAKARRAISVPLNADAVSIIRRWSGKHPTHVFSFRGTPIRQVSTKAWYQALKKAGIQAFRWHDLRHTWASWHVQDGTPLFALQELGGWESAEMVRRYAHLSAEHLAPYADRLCSLRVVENPVDGTFSSHPTNEKELAVANS